MRAINDMSILITGGGSGIGLGAAEHFAARGALVTITGRRSEPLEKASKNIGDRCSFVIGDVTKSADRQAMIDAAIKHGGGIDALLSVAGNFYSGSISDLEEDRFLELFHTNVVGGIMLAQLAKPHLADRKGCIVFVGSVHTQIAHPGASPYAATKGAIEALTGVLAAELGSDGIRVSCVRPGAVHTELIVRSGLMKTSEDALARLESMASAHAMGRIGTVEEIAEAFEYLVRAEWTTGDVFNVDGGLSLGITRA